MRSSDSVKAGELSDGRIRIRSVGKLRFGILGLWVLGLGFEVHLQVLGGY